MTIKEWVSSRVLSRMHNCMKKTVTVSPKVQLCIDAEDMVRVFAMVHVRFVCIFKVSVESLCLKNIHTHFVNKNFV